MTTNRRLAYVQARLQARHGQRLTEARWRLLEATPDLGTYLQSARATSLRPWIIHLPSEADTHLIERSLRLEWGDYVDGIASWVGSDWQDAIHWLSSLPYLPHFVHLLRNEPAPHWMLDDPVLSNLAHSDAERRREALRTTALAGIADGIHGGDAPMTVWLDDWVRRFPTVTQDTRRALDRLRQTYETHAAAILDDPSRHPAGPLLRQRLGERLNSAFRRHSGRIAALFAHLGLMALDAERLRAGLVLRALFRDPARRPRWA